MHRTIKNLESYRQTMLAVLNRADNMCEVLVDQDGNACTDNQKTRCCKYISLETAKYVNFLHKSTRNGKSEDWVLDPNNVILGCERHHVEEEKTGKRVCAVDYDLDEITYIPTSE